MDTVEILRALLVGLALLSAAPPFIECHELDSCRALYPLDGPSGAADATTWTAGNNDAISWNASAVVAPRDMNNTAFLKSMCQCDDRCAVFGDCCRDAAKVYGTKGERQWSCQPLWKTNAKNDWKVSIYVVAQCPRTFVDNDESIRAMCERSGVEPQIYSHLIDIPVLSLGTNVTYANVFCARCHGDADELKRWDFTFRCDQNIERLNVSVRTILSQGRYLAGTRKWIYRTPSISINCVLVIELFTDVVEYSRSTNARRCIPNIGHCASDWRDDSPLCSLYTFYVIDPTTNQVYRNADCARCNSVDETDYLCNRPSAFSGPFRGRFSFSGVFDFSFGWDVSAHDDDNRVGVERRCSSNEIFDHLYNRCHSIVCGAMFANRNGVCEREGSTGVDEREFLNSSCPRLNLKTGIDYIALDNGSIVLNKTNEMLHPNDYEQTSNDSVQICYDEERQDYYFKYSIVQRYVSDLCLSVSVVCLAFHIAIHCAVPKLRNLPGKNLLSLSCALLLAQFLFLSLIDSRQSIGRGPCIAVGVLGHWSYLSAFFWMNVMGVDVSRTFVRLRVRHEQHNSNARRSTFRWYSAYAWGSPSAIVVFGLLVDLAGLSELYGPRYGEHLCWICNKRGLGAFFVLPVAVLLFVNSILFTLTICSIVRQKRAARFAVQINQTYREPAGGRQSDAISTSSVVQRRFSADTKHEQRIRFVLYLKLALIMGLGWVSGFVAALADVHVLWYPFIVFNALQGAFIFVTFDCKVKIYFMLYRRLMKRPHPLDRASSTTNARTRTAKTSTTSAQPIMAASQFVDQDDSSSTTANLRSN